MTGLKFRSSFQNLFFGSIVREKHLSWKQNLKILKTMQDMLERVFCENWQGRAKALIIPLRDPAAHWQFQVQNFIWILNYCGNIAPHRSRCFLFPYFCFIFFFLPIRIVKGFCATSYYFFNISNFVAILWKLQVELFYYSTNCQWNPFYTKKKCG